MSRSKMYCTDYSGEYWDWPSWPKSPAEIEANERAYNDSKLPSHYQSKRDESKEFVVTKVNRKTKTVTISPIL